MFDSYLKLEKSPAMERAIARCRQIHPKVHTVSVDARIYTIRSKSDPKVEYVIKFNVANGEKFGACTCRAGRQSRVCYHIPGAYQQHVINMRQRWRAESLAAPTGVEAAASEPGEGSNPSPRQLADDAPEGEDAAPGNVELFCAECGQFLSDGHCLDHPRAAAVTERKLAVIERENSVLLKQPMKDTKCGFMSV